MGELVDIKSFPHVSVFDKSGLSKNNFGEFFASSSFHIYRRRKLKLSIGIMCRSSNAVQNHNAYVFIHKFVKKIKRTSANVLADKDAFVEKCKVEAYKIMCEIARFEDEYVGYCDEYTNLSHVVCTDFAILILTPTYRYSVVCGNSWVVMHHDVNLFPQRPKFAPVSIPYSKKIGEDLYSDMERKDIAIDIAKRHFRSYVNERVLDARVDPTFMAIANRRFLKMFHNKPAEFTKEVTDFIGCMMLKNNTSFEFWANKYQPQISPENNVLVMW